MDLDQVIKRVEIKEDIGELSEVVSDRLIVGVDISKRKEYLSIFDIFTGVLYVVVMERSGASYYSSILEFMRNKSILLLIEKPFLLRNIRTYGDLSNVAHEFYVLSEVANLYFDAHIEVRYVEPTLWQSDILGITGRVRSKERKKIGMDYVKKYLDIDIKDHNITDSILICFYAYKEWYNKIKMPP